MTDKMAARKITTTPKLGPTRSMLKCARSHVTLKTGTTVRTQTMHWANLNLEAECAATEQHIAPCMLGKHNDQTGRTLELLARVAPAQVNPLCVWEHGESGTRAGRVSLHKFDPLLAHC
jgi:hypothetical protein